MYWLATRYQEVVEADGGGGSGKGRLEELYLTLHCHHQNDFCIKMGSNESHFSVSLIVRGESQDSVH